jgi:hypothetical protein
MLAAAALSVVACSSHAAKSGERAATFAGLPIYPNASVVGVAGGNLALYRSQDAYATVAGWYASHMPASAHVARNDARSQATFSEFLTAETKSVHVEVADGTVWITVTDVRALVQPSPTGR